MTTTLLACAGAPEQSAAGGRAANLEFVRSPSWVSALRWAEPRPAGLAASATIGSAGGTLELKRTGLVLTVPAGAVDRPTRFAVRAVPGRIVAYELEPHATRFALPLVVEQRLHGTERATDPGVVIEGAHFGDVSQLDEPAGVAAVDEFRPARRSGDGLAVQVEVRHFSGFVLSVGRR